MTTFMQELAARLRQRRQELDVAERTLVALTRDAGKAEARYSALTEAAGSDQHNYLERREAERALAAVNDQLQRQHDAVLALQAEVSQIDGMVSAPAKLKDAINSLSAARAAAVAAVARRDKAVEKVERLQAQLHVEQAAAATSRQWATEQILARVEGRDPLPGERPAHPPEVHAQAETLIAGLIESEHALLAQIDSEVVAMREATAEAETNVLQAAANVREVELAEAVAVIAPAWSRYRASYIAAFGRVPTAPDLDELGRIDADQAETEARQVLVAEQPGLLRRAVQRVAEVVRA